MSTILNVTASHTILYLSENVLCSMDNTCNNWNLKQLGKYTNFVDLDSTRYLFLKRDLLGYANDNSDMSFLKDCDLSNIFLLVIIQVITFQPPLSNLMVSIFLWPFISFQPKKGIFFRNAGIFSKLRKKL